EVIEESQGLDLAKALLKEGHRVVVYDPAAMENARPHLVGVTFASSAAECAKVADILAITTPWEEFRNLTSDDLNTSGRRVILDCWRLLPKNVATAEEHIWLGVGTSGERSNACMHPVLARAEGV